MAKKKRARSNGSLKQFKKRASRMLICVGLISTISLVGYGAWTARHILEPISIYASEESEFGVYAETDQIRFYTLQLDEQDYVTQASLSIVDTHEQTLKTIHLPAETIMHLPYGFDEFKLASLYKIANLEQGKDTHSLINQTLTEYFGVPAKTIYIVKTNSESETPFSTWLTQPFTMFKLTFDKDWATQNLITSQSPWNMLHLAQVLRGIPAEMTTDIDIVEYGIGSKEISKDGSPVVTSDQNKLDAYIKKSFQNIALMQEKANIQIENSTQVTGLGGKFARIVTNMGGVVIDVGNRTEISEKTQIIISKKEWENSATVIELKRALIDCEVFVSPESSTSDITVIIGNSYASLIEGNTSL